MRCHYCDRDAAYAASSRGVTVGLCEEHVKERMEDLARSAGLRRLGEKLDVDPDP